MADALENGAATPARILVVCCDGTWNDPDSDTNVWRTFRFLRNACVLESGDPHATGDVLEFRGGLLEQRTGRNAVRHRVAARYERGVGDDRGGGAFGVGLAEKVRNAYRFIVENWEVGARIFIFGFSRGAYTARSLAGLLNAAGVVRNERAAVEEAWNYYRSPRGRRSALLEQRLIDLQATDAKLHTPVRFLGVWDTVGSLGVPVLSVRRAFDSWLGQHYRFHNTGLGRNVIHANQALAIHEQRGAFKPVLWTRRFADVRDEAGRETRQHMLQVWFAGSHADVGGGYRGDRGLADVALDWMLRRAVQAGLPLEERAWLDPGGDLASVIKCEPNPFAARNISSNWLWRTVAGQNPGLVDFLLDRLPVVVRVPLGGLRQVLRIPDVERAIGGETPTDDGHFVVGLGQRLHQSVIRRYRGDHRPSSVKTALTAELPIFHERASARTPCRPDTTVIVDEEEATLVDRSKVGLGVGGVPWLSRGATCRVAIDSRQWQARVAWAESGRAGLDLLHPVREGQVLN